MTPDHQLRSAVRCMERDKAKRDTAIRELRGDGWSLDRLAKAAGVSKATMQSWVRRLER